MPRLRDHIAGDFILDTHHAPTLALQARFLMDGSQVLASDLDFVVHFPYASREY